MSNSKSIKEVVVYRIKPNQTQAFIDKGLDELRTCASGFRGMLRHDTLVSAKDSRLFIDLVEWDSLESAEKASVQLDAKAKAGERPLMTQTFERVEFFDHFKAFS